MAHNADTQIVRELIFCLREYNNNTVKRAELPSHLLLDRCTLPMGCSSGRQRWSIGRGTPQGKRCSPRTGLERASASIMLVNSSAWMVMLVIALPGWCDIAVCDDCVGVARVQRVGGCCASALLLPSVTALVLRCCC